MKPTLIIYLAIGAFFLPVCTSQAQAEQIRVTCMQVIESIERGDFEAFHRLQRADFYAGEKNNFVLRSDFNQIVAYYQHHHAGKSKLEFRQSTTVGGLDRVLVAVNLFEKRGLHPQQLHFTGEQPVIPTFEKAIIATAKVCDIACFLPQQGFSAAHPTRAGPFSTLS